MEEYLALVDAARRTTETVTAARQEVRAVVADVKKAKRKVSAYSKRYGAAYKRLKKRYTTKKGAYRKGYNHKRLVKLAHKEAKRGGKK